MICRKKRGCSIKLRDSIFLHFAMELSSGYKDFVWATNINRIMLKIVGLWPPDNQDARKILHSKLRLLYNLVTLLFVVTIPALVSLTHVWGDMILMIDNLQYSLSFLITILKVCIIWNKQKALAPLIDMIVRDWTQVKMKEERDVMVRHAKITRTLAVCAIIIICCLLFISLVLPYFGLTMRHVTNLTDFGKSLPVPSYYLHDVSKSPQFELTLLAQGFALLISGISYFAVDHFLGLLIIHVCGQLTNLNSRLSHMDKYLNYDAVLKHNVEDHVRLIRSIQIIDDTFNLLLLSLILFFGTQFCLQGFLVVNIIKQKEHLSFMTLGWFVMSILCTLLHMCLYCAVGEILATQSGKVHQATYKFAWYTKEPSRARDLILIMLRANKPFYITAGKIFPMTMATFCNLLKTSAGYISVLLANQK